MSDNATIFHQLHEGPQVLVLPNAWDAASAALMSDAGAAAVATSSAAVAWARGYPDGDALPVPVLLQVIAECARASKVPRPPTSRAATPTTWRPWPRRSRA